MKATIHAPRRGYSTSTVLQIRVSPTMVKVSSSFLTVWYTLRATGSRITWSSNQAITLLPRTLDATKPA